MMSIGHRTGLFDKMADLPASTSADPIARTPAGTIRTSAKMKGSMRVR